MNKRVAIIDPLGAHGSSHHFYLFGQSIGLIKNGVQVTLYTNNETTDPKIEGLRFYAFYQDIFASSLRIINGIRWIIGSTRSIFHASKSKISIFHFHVFDINILILFNVLLVKLLFGKVILTIHDVESFTNDNNSKRLSNLVYNLTDLVLTHNQFSKSEITNRNPDISTHISIVPHGNYTSFINLSNKKAKSQVYLGLPKDKKIILFFGMIKKVKGLDVLLKSFKKVVDKHPDTILLIAGKPWKNDFIVYQKIIDKHNLTKNIILHTKFISHDDVEHYYCVSDLVVLPYKRIYQSGVLMMTLSYERPALVSDLPALKEVLIDNENGFLFKSEDINHLAERLDFILSNPETLERVRKNGSLLVNTKFGWDEIGRLTLNAYKNL